MKYLVLSFLCPLNRMAQIPTGAKMPRHLQEKQSLSGWPYTQHKQFEKLNGKSLKGFTENKAENWMSIYIK